MIIVNRYSHLNGWEFLQVHKPGIWREIEDSIGDIDAEQCRNKISQEKRTKGQRLYSPVMMNQAMKKQ